MKAVYSSDPAATEYVPNSIFLAGPTPRDKETKSWRPHALQILEQLGFEGTVFIPEREDWTTLKSYDDQVEWEYACLSNCSVIGFWLPRDLDVLPGFTTNTEIGFWLAKDPKKVVYGRPNNAPKTRYQDWLYRKFCGVDPYENLESTMEACKEVSRLE